jgi:hypothetical protein
MADTKPDEWRVAVARELDGEARAALEKIGQQLQFKLAKIVSEPLPPRLQYLVSELEQKLDQDDPASAEEPIVNRSL